MQSRPLRSHGQGGNILIDLFGLATIKRLAFGQLLFDLRQLRFQLGAVLGNVVLCGFNLQGRQIEGQADLINQISGIVCLHHIKHTDAAFAD